MYLKIENIIKIIIFLFFLYVLTLRTLYRRSTLSTINMKFTHWALGGEEEDYFSFENNSVIRLWIDVPNSFPWRKCINVYKSKLYTYSCNRNYQSRYQIFTVVTFLEDETKFQLYHEELEIY